MRELFLLPKSTYERLISNRKERKKSEHILQPFRNVESNTSKQGFTTVIPPGQVKEKKVGLKSVGWSLKKSDEKKKDQFDGENNPTLNHLIPSIFSSVRIGYVKSLLNLLKNTNLIRWNAVGDLSSPIVGYNILDVIKDFDGNKLPSNWNPKMSTDYSTLFKYMNIPPVMIRNKSIRSHIDPTFKRGSGKRRMVHNTRNHEIHSKIHMFGNKQTAKKKKKVGKETLPRGFKDNWMTY